MYGTPPPTRTGITLLLREPRLPIAPVGHGGNRRDRTADRHRMKVLLYQLSYITKSGSGGGNRTPTNGFGDRRTAIILHRNRLEQRVRFELTVLGICSPLHWASLPPLRKIGGNGGIRTHGSGLSLIDGLANRCLRPLSHVSV